MLDSQGTLVIVLAPLGVVLRVLMLFVGKAHFCDKNIFGLSDELKFTRKY